MIRWLIGRLFVVYVASNMLLCSLIFFPWARPRETVSGLVGRWCRTEGGWKLAFAKRVAPAVNWLYSFEPNHCIVTHEVEHEAHTVLYPPKVPAPLLTVRTSRTKKKGNGACHP
jgi:hypothetical protein